MKGIYTTEAPELGACCVVGIQCTQQLRPPSPKAGRILEDIQIECSCLCLHVPGMES